MAFGLFKKKKQEVKQDTGIITLTVKEVVKETADAVSIHFNHPEGKKIAYKAGQYFTLIVNINGKEERRAYSVCSSPFVDANPAVAVKRVEDGKVSNYLNSELKAGDSIRVIPPLGNFTTELSASNSRNVVLIAGGSGITPMMSLAKSVLSQEPNSKVTLVYANRDAESIIFRKQLEDIQAENSRLSIIHVLENNSSDYGQHEGYLTQSIIQEVKLELNDEKAEYFICGPGPMMDIAINSLKNLGVSEQLIRKESFTTSSKSDAASKEKSANEGELVAREVTIILDGEEHKFVVEPKESILEKGLDQMLDMPFSCQSGLCTACRGKCLSGKVKMDESDGLSQAELDEGYVLLCVGHPMTDDVVVEIG